MKLTKDILIDFFERANLYQSIDVSMFDINEFAYEYIKKKDLDTEIIGFACSDLTSASEIDLENHLFNFAKMMTNHITGATDKWRKQNVDLYIFREFDKNGNKE